MTLRQIAEWVVNTCLLYGTTEATAYQIAGLFLKGLDAATDDNSDGRKANQRRET